MGDRVKFIITYAISFGIGFFIQYLIFDNVIVEDLHLERFLAKKLPEPIVGFIIFAPMFVFAHIVSRKILDSINNDITTELEFFMDFIGLIMLMFIKENSSPTPKTTSIVEKPSSPSVEIDHEAEERRRREQEEADERAFWNSPEGRRLRAERELAEIRRKEREEAAEMARRMAEEEHKRQQEALKTLKDL